jgi:hypothetical protein
MSKEPQNFLECLLEELTQTDASVKELARRLENLPLLHDGRPQLEKEFRLAQDKLFDLTLEYVAATQAPWAAVPLPLRRSDPSEPEKKTRT